MAEDEAVALRHAEVGTEHLLLGLLREGGGLATRVLRELGAEPTDLGHRVRARLAAAPIAAVGPIGLGPGARSAIEMARAEAGRLHHDYLGTEHVLLGLLRDGEGPAFVVLNGAGVTLGRARQQIAAILNDAAPDPLGGPSGERPSRLAVLRGRDRSFGRYADPDASIPRDTTERCGRCGRVRQSDWRFCAFCGERWPACDRCEAPIPGLPGVRFCPGCGVMLESTDRA